MLSAVALGASPPTPSGPPPPALVVIDPGHGGPNRGALGNGRMEKDITLDVAKRVAALLEKETGVRVALTREDDVHIPLRDRARMANMLQADAFVSIHCNASETPGPRGYETWFLSPDGSRQALHREQTRRHAGVHDDELDGSTVSESVQAILGDLVSQQAHRGGSRLASEIHEALGAALPPGTPSRGVKQGAYTVLVAAATPATVVEMGFLNHPEEGPSFDLSKQRQRLARGIADGIRRFLGSRAS